MLFKALQVAHNKAAKVVTRMGWFTPTRTLLKQVGWLSVKQLVVFHTALTTQKIVTHQKPR